MAQVQHAIAKAAGARQILPEVNAGYAAQGESLALSFFGVVKAHQADYGRFITTAWNLSTEARDYAKKRIDAMVRQARENAQSVRAGVDGLTKQQWASIASTATVRASQFGRILRAMNGGMTAQTVMETLNVESVEHLSFDTILGVAKKYAESEAAAGGRGRPRVDFLHKLARFVTRETTAEGVTPEDVKQINKILKLIGDMLPDLEAEKEAAKKVAAGQVKVPAKTEKAKPVEKQTPIKAERPGRTLEKVKAAKKVAKPLVLVKNDEGKTVAIPERREQIIPVKKDQRAEPHVYHNVPAAQQ